MCSTVVWFKHFQHWSAEYSSAGTRLQGLRKRLGDKVCVSFDDVTKQTIHQKADNKGMYLWNS